MGRESGCSPCDATGTDVALFLVTAQFHWKIRDVEARSRALEGYFNRKSFGKRWYKRKERVLWAPNDETIKDDGSVHLHISMKVPQVTAVAPWKLAKPRVTVPEGWDPNNPEDMRRFGGFAWSFYSRYSWFLRRTKAGKLYRKANPAELTTLRALVMSYEATKWGREEDWNGSKLLYGNVWVQECPTQEDFDRALDYQMKGSRPRALC